LLALEHLLAPPLVQHRGGAFFVSAFNRSSPRLVRSLETAMSEPDGPQDGGIVGVVVALLIVFVIGTMLMAFGR
jgi:hypothetical protein